MLKTATVFWHGLANTLAMLNGHWLRLMTAMTNSNFHTKVATQGVQTGWEGGTHPPAGPDRTALCPEKRFTGASPPSDCIKDSCTSLRSEKPDSNVSMYLQVTKRISGACMLRLHACPCCKITVLYATYLCALVIDALHVT